MPRCGVTNARLYVFWDKALESGHASLLFQNKLQLKAIIMHRHSASFNVGITRYLLINALYVKSPLFETIRRDPMCHVIRRLQESCTLFELPPPHRRGTPGHPRQYEDKQDQLVDSTGPDGACELVLYGVACEFKMLSKVVKNRKYAAAVRIIISQFEETRSAKQPLFLCTDTTLDLGQALQLFAARFSLKNALWLRYLRMFLLAQCWLR